MLFQRVATSVVGVPIVITLILVGGGWYAGAAALILALATLEFQAPVLGWRHPLSLLAAALSAGLAAGALVGLDWLVWFATGAILIPLVWVATAGGDPRQGAERWLWTLGGVFYIGWLGAHLVLLRESGNGRDWVFLALLATFANDTAAYFVGRALGRRPLSPRVSPGKTVEGAVGGFAGALSAVLLLNYFLGIRMGAALVLPLALLLPLAAQLGDLVESTLKRAVGVKDAGALLPGHGGLMDRLDSVLLTTVVVYYYLLWVVP
ncbi:MAG: phosphatidate cytidylyltransferase [Dehalococcoidia bacterium]